MDEHRATLRFASAGDIPELVALLRELFLIEQDFSPDKVRQKRGLELLLDCPERAVIVVARDENGAAVAMVSAQLVVSTAEGAPSVWIEDMVVRAEHRRKGLGCALLEKALVWARDRGATRAQLLVDLDNSPAVDFYQRMGWKATRLEARRLFLF